MRISFRQGLVRVPPNFLQLASSKVSLVVPSGDTLIAAFADGEANYLISERQSVANAWQGPFVGGSQSYWLYWDINATTGQKTFGHTLLEPVEGANAPSTPLNDQHWFDTTVNKMKVWNSTASRWVNKIRVFAAKLSNGSVFVSMSINSPVYTGTQIGNLQAVAVNAGALVFDSNNQVVKRTNGTFLTTEDVVLTGSVSSSQVKFGSLVIEAEAVDTISAYSIVRFTSFNKVSVATNYVLDNGAYGIVEVDAASGDIINIVMEGLITNSEWDWTSAGINAPLYVNINGELTTTPPPTPIAVAAVIDPYTILLRPSSLFLHGANDPASTTNEGTVTLSVAPVDAEMPIAVGDNDPRVTNTLAHISDTALHLSVSQNTFLDALTSVTGGVVVRKSDGTGISRTLTGPAAGLSITNGDGNSGNPTFALTNDLSALEGLSATGMAVRTDTDTWATRSITASGSGITVTNGTGVAGNPAISVANDLAAVEGLSGAGIAVRTDVDTWAIREVAVTGDGLTVTNPTGVLGDIGLAISDDLAAVEALSSTGLATRTGNETWEARTLTAPAAGMTITNPAGVAGNPTFVLANDLGELEGLTTYGIAVRDAEDSWKTAQLAGQSGEITVTNADGVAAGDVIVGLTNAGTPVTGSFVKITTDSKGRVTATVAPGASDINTALGYTAMNRAGDTMSGVLNMGGSIISNVGTPSSATDAANKGYVDGLVSGLDVKSSVRAATTGNTTLSGTQVIDGVSLVVGNRVLVRAQTDTTQNGIWVVAAGSWTRATDALPGTTLNAGAYTFVEEGTLYGDSGWVLTTNDPITINVTALAFEQFSGAGQVIAGAGLTKSGNQLDVGTASTGRIIVNANDIDLASGILSSPGTYKSVTVDTYGRVTAATNPTTLSGYGILDAQPLDADLTSLAGLSTTGISVRSATNTWLTRTITGVSNEITVTNGDGAAANPSLGLASNPVLPGTGGAYMPSGTTAQVGTATNGGLRYDSTLLNMRMVEGGAWKDVGTIRLISVSNPAAGITLTPSVSNSTTTITTALANDLAAVEGLSSTGLAVRTATDTWAVRTITGTAGRVTVANGGGVAGDPTIDLVSGVIGTPGVYKSVTVDTYGRITAGTNPTTLVGFGIVDAQPLSTALTNFAGTSSVGVLVQTAAGTYAARTLSSPAEGLSITNPTGAGGNPTFALTNDLLAIEALSSTGFAVRTAADTWAQRQITGTTNRVTVTNGAGTSADPVVDIAGTYVGQTSITTLGTIATGTWQGTAVTPAYGGTGTTSLGTLNQLLGVNAAGSAGEYKTLNGTANQIVVVHGANSITLNTPQSLATTSSVQFDTVLANHHRTTVASLISGASINWDMAAGSHATLTLGTNATLNNPTNMTAGTIVVLRVTQDGVGTRTLAFGTAYKFVAGADPVVTATANAVSLLTFWSDGTNLFEVSRALNLS